MRLISVNPKLGSNSLKKNRSQPFFYITELTIKNLLPDVFPK